MVNNTNGNIGIPPTVGIDMSDVKLAHDRYQVFVNGEFVGDKVILGQNEDAFDIEHYLNTRGFEEFSVDLNGDHVLIEAAADTAAEIKESLGVYLTIR